MKLHFSIIIPVYNRPQEIDELLQSLSAQKGTTSFDVNVIEDGSIFTCEEVINKHKNQLTISYFKKENSGAGASRNFGMQKATGNYFIILDSDVILPSNYLHTVKTSLSHNYCDFFGGPDAAHKSFTSLQKAINYSMTSVLTTGGIRGGKQAAKNFQPRSFNMGISKAAFEKSNGFSSMNYGEDIDLSLRLNELGFKSRLIENAFVYHKRRTSLKQFFKQTFNFGTARPVLTKKFPQTAKLAFWFPALFIIGLLMSVILFILSFYVFLFVFISYFIAIFIHSTYQNKKVAIGFLSTITTLVMFFGYGLGFIKSRLQQL